ncbi:MAG: hypothetical protein KMY55_01385 [Dethiosulfatibacter sp.]|nr:hypothetical protein [Dethiosulfatibacter sp.]
MLGEEGKVVDYETNDFYLKYYTDGKWRFDKFYLMQSIHHFTFMDY